MNNKLVSIIVPVYNSQEYLGRCIESLIHQIYEKIEILIINDGSTDSSLDICQEYSIDPRIRIINKQNGGVSSARNLGIAKAMGDYICFVDSDDYICPNMIGSLLYNMEKYDVDMSICNMIYVKNNKEYINNSHDKYIDSKECFYENEFIYQGYLCNKMFKTDIARKIRLDETIFYCEDELFVTEYVELCNSFYYCDKGMYYYMITDNGSSNLNVWNEKKLTIIRAKEKELDILKKYNANTIKYFYISYFDALNDAYNRYSKSKISGDKIKKLYKYINENCKIDYRSKISIYIKYHFYNIYYFVKKVYKKIR